MKAFTPLEIPYFKEDYNRNSLNKKSQKFLTGFTLIEILLVIIILAVLAGSAIPISINFYKTQQLDTHAKGVVQALRRAQLKAMSIESDSIFGVYLTDDNYILFKGSSFDIRDISYDEVFDLPQIITVSGIQEITFSKFEGMPNTIGNIILNNNGNTRTISINKMGRLNLE